MTRTFGHTTTISDNSSTIECDSVFALNLTFFPCPSSGFPKTILEFSGFGASHRSCVNRDLKEIVPIIT